MNMKSNYLFGNVLYPFCRAIILMCFAGIILGCPAEKPPISRKAQSFKQDMLMMLKTYSTPLVVPVAQGDKKAIDEIIEKLIKEKKDNLPVPDAVDVLDKNGIHKAGYPKDVPLGYDYSQYRITPQVLQKGKYAQGRFYSHGAKAYCVLAPLRQKDKIVGALAISYWDKKMEEEWGLSEEEFLKIDFNQ
jgi:hypothetical protein